MWNRLQTKYGSRLTISAAFLLGFALPISTAADNIFALLIFGVWLLSGNWRNKFERLRGNSGALFAGALFLLAAAGMLWSPGITKESLKYFEKYASLLLLLCLVSLPMRLDERKHAILGFGGGVVVTFVLSYALGLGLFPETWFPSVPRDDPSPFKLHITHGFFVAIGAYIFFLRATEAESRAGRWCYSLLALLAAGNALYVQGRTGHLTLIVLSGYWFVSRFRWRGVALSLLGAGFAVVVSLQFPESRVTSRAMEALNDIQAWHGGSSEMTSMGVRMQWAVNSVKIIREHPWFGVGTGGFEEAYRLIAAEGSLLTKNPHNQYLLTSAQLGGAGLMLLLAMFLGFWLQSRQLQGSERLLARGILLAYLAANLFNSFFYDHSEARFFAWSLGLLFCGVGVRASSQQRDS